MPLHITLPTFTSRRLIFKKMNIELVGTWDWLLVIPHRSHHGLSPSSTYFTHIRSPKKLPRKKIPPLSAVALSTHRDLKWVHLYESFFLLQKELLAPAGNKCSHATVYFLGVHSHCLSYAIIWCASLYRIAHVKENIYSCKNMVKVISSNCGLNSAFVLHGTDNITVGS